MSAPFEYDGYGHGIKNAHIIHMVEPIDREPYIPRDPGWRYICIGACVPTPSKSTTDPKKVTCKNCIREMKKDPGYYNRKYGGLAPWARETVAVQIDGEIQERPILPVVNQFVQNFPELNQSEVQEKMREHARKINEALKTVDEPDPSLKIHSIDRVYHESWDMKLTKMIRFFMDEWGMISVIPLVIWVPLAFFYYLIEDFIWRLKHKPVDASTYTDWGNKMVKITDFTGEPTSHPETPRPKKVDKEE